MGIEDILKGRQTLFVKVEREVEYLFTLIKHFPTRHNLPDGVLVGIHRIIDFLHGGQYGAVEPVDGLVELRPLEAFFLQIPSAVENAPRHRGGDAPCHASFLAHILEAVRGITERTVQEKLRQPITLRCTQQGCLRIHLSFHRTHIGTTKQQFPRHPHPYRLHIVGQGLGNTQGIGHILRIKPQKYRQGIEVPSHVGFSNRDGCQRAIIDGLRLCHIEFGNETGPISGFGDSHHRLLRCRIALEYIHFLLHLAKVEISRSHLGTKAHHRGIVFLLACGIKFLLRPRFLTNRPEHIELPTHLHGCTVISRPSLRTSRSKIATCLLAVPSSLERQRRIKIALRNPPLRLRLVDAVNCHQHRRILLHRQVYQ